MKPIDEILKLLPHRYPFLMVDRVLERDAGKRVVALKNVTINEPYFQGHYPLTPVMPGVMIVEAMAQAGGLAVSGGPLEDVVPLLAALQRVKFRRVVKPGDQLIITAVVTAVRGGFVKVAARGEVDGELAAEGELSFMPML
ncbi:MAG TPA: 3-hydroxyacyl-ACP dehydratase FabZ [Firmicutes bacterium]|nr:3-hydroxyacyl-ACP dehydratase FabZ [Bacillota bacterium]